MRLNYHKTSPELVGHMIALENALAEGPVEKPLYQLVKLRASQINGCAFCLAVHVPEARAAGVSQQKLDVLAGWRESPAFDARERAALGWCEALTRIEATGAPDAEWEAVVATFTPGEQVALTLVITTVNAWNRIAIGFRQEHGARA